MTELIKEGKAKLKAQKPEVVSKDMEVFYNPLMKFNRDISILLLNSIDKTKLNIADPLAGSGIRSIRFLLELKKSKIDKLTINDYSEDAVKSIKKNLSLNKIKKSKKIIIKNEDANLFLLNSTGFDYIDIDPFGTPNPYLDSAVKRIARDGILAVTATDTSSLAGTYPLACLRKYWSVPLKNELKHEMGLRILIRKVQLVGAQYNKALTPIFSYSKDHYMRIFFQCEKSKVATDNILNQHSHFEKSGPIWLGQLFEKKLVNNMLKNNKIEENEKILSIIKEESKINTVGFYDIHELCKKYKIKHIPKKEELMKKIKKLGFKASVTHFSPIAIRSDIKLKNLLKII